MIKKYIKIICAAQNRLSKHRSQKRKVERSINKLVIIYRISDAGYKKEKPTYINNESCLRNAVTIFPCKIYEWLLIADNCSTETITMIEKYVPRENILEVSIGHGAGTFNLALNKALAYDNDTIVYFLENDYLHLPSSDKILFEGFELGASDYVTLYDHPDKYTEFIRGGEKTVVFLSKSIHWKITNSTTMTFASKVKSLKRDEKILRRWTTGHHPFDFEMFTNLRMKNRILISPIPGFSTHGETEFLTPLIIWDKV
jgi:hypothetical protein